MSFAEWLLLAVQLITTIVVGAIGFFLKRELKRYDTLEHRLYKLEVKVAEECVHKDDFNRVNGELLAKVDKIYDLLFDIKGGKMTCH